MSVRRVASLLLLCFLAAPPIARARWVWTSETGLVNTEDYELGDPKELYERAKSTYDAGEYSDAATEFTRIAYWSHSPVYREKAMFMRAESFFQAGEYDPAYEAYEEYLSDYPRTRRLKHILQKELDIGLKFMEGAKRYLPLVPLAILPARDYGKEIMQELLGRYPYEEFSDKYHYQLASRLLENEEMEEARLEFELFRKTYPHSPWGPTAQFQIAFSFLSQYLGPDYDETPLLEARKEFQTYLDENPQGDRVEEARNHLQQIRRLQHEKDFEQAEYWLWRDHPHAAMIYLEGILRDEPDPGLAEKARALYEQLEQEYGPCPIPPADSTQEEATE